MTEEIIIDGINVTGCEFCKPNPLYKIEYSCNCRGYIQDDGLHVHLSCEHNPNCYYKQLKRLEQENKELKEKIIELSEEKGHLIVENNTLKESNQSLSILGTDLASAHETVRKEFFRADKNKDMWREKAEEYRSALEEIREIEELAYYSKGISEEQLSQRDFILDAINNYEQRRIKILNKINEVLQ